MDPPFMRYCTLSLLMRIVCSSGNDSLSRTNACQEIWNSEHEVNNVPLNGTLQE